MIEILPIPAFEDNYIWFLRSKNHAVVVDPGDATPVIETIKESGLILDAILVTHHHNDHIGGVHELISRYHEAVVYAPAREAYNFPHVPAVEGDSVRLGHLGLNLTVLEVPGHTLGHVAYYGNRMLFCGDTLFACGCGRLFEGTPAQMHASLQRLASLPRESAVYCTHEYTEHNIRFARALDPDNQALLQRQQQVARIREAGKPSLPSTIGLELETNPFLRCDAPAIRKAAGINIPGHALEVFTVIRNMRNHY
ncbi:hydroxyacylglutathione hydrolase [Methylophilaceae bacterium]|nr:hydroxyacylglutathione hydrolase [Methylophilaceae bacterium]